MDTHDPISVTHPQIAATWNQQLNEPHTPSQYPASSSRSFWWNCPHNHTWKTSIRNRIQGTKCHICSNRIILPGFNDLATTHPDIAKQWHPTKNGDLTPDKVNPKTVDPHWWVGDCKHEWESSVNSRTQKHAGCPYCSGNKLLPGFNDLATTHPNIAARWHPTKNGDLTPEQVMAGSHRKVWWLGDCKHEWETEIVSRKRYGCPICAGKIPHPGNRLSDINPAYLTQWHPTKNGDLTPNQVTQGSNKRIWWQCSQGHEWETTISERNRGKNCQECSYKIFISKPEEELQQYIKSLEPSIQTSNRTLLNGTEIDIYIPSKKVGVEYNGLYWHNENAGKTRTYHQKKYEAAKQAGIQLIQIWEDDWNHNPDLVKRVLAHKLGVSDQPAVYARKTRIEALTTTVARVFLTGNHIQGFASGNHYLGLRDIETSTLVAVMVLKKEPGQPGTLNIARYATSTRVPGGFTKLLKHAEREYQPTRFITFADHCVSDGGLYEQNGFVADKILPPDYMYVVKGERAHKFGYRIKKFRNDPALKYEEGLTEKQLATLNNLPRIWDAGKTRYTKQVTPN